MKSTYLILCLAGLAGGSAVRGDEITFASKTSQTHLIELFTSEGCSSCPPAEAWLDKLKNDNRLWQDFVPVAFHVDYWDNLGWKDRFAQSEWTQRQRAYANKWGSSSVYTPGFVLDGREWQDWRDGSLFSRKENAGVLVVKGSRDIVRISFEPGSKIADGSAHLAWLGLNLLSNVKAGENAGRNLHHEFVVLRHATVPLKSEANGTWEAELSASFTAGDAGAIACWIESGGVPIQATGGWLTAITAK